MVNRGPGVGRLSPNAEALDFFKNLLWHLLRNSALSDRAILGRDRGLYLVARECVLVIR